LERLDGRHAHLLRDAVGEILIDGGEDGQLSRDDMFGLALTNMPSDVVDESFLGSIVHDLLPESAWLLKVDFVDLAEMGLSVAEPPLMLDLLVTFLLIGQWSDAALIVGSRALADESAVSVPLEVGNGYNRSVDWQLLIVHTQTVTVCIRVREQTRLEHRVRGWFNARNSVRRGESGLLDLGEVVLRILVKDELANRLEWVIFVRPDLGQIENVVSELFGLFGCHGLDIDGPAGFLATVDCLEEGLDTVIGVGTSDLRRLFLSQVLEATIGSDVNLDVGELALLVDELEGMARVTVLVMVAVGNSTITEEDHDLVDRLGVL